MKMEEILNIKKQGYDLQSRRHDGPPELTISSGGPGSGRKPRSGVGSSQYQSLLKDAVTNSHIAGADPSQTAHREASKAHAKAAAQAKAEGLTDAFAYHDNRAEYHTNRAASYNKR